MIKFVNHQVTRDKHPTIGDAITSELNQYVHDNGDVKVEVVGIIYHPPDATCTWRDDKGELAEVILRLLMTDQGMTRDDLVQRLEKFANSARRVDYRWADAMREAAATLAAPPAAPRNYACGPSDVCRDDGCQCACHAAAPPADLVAIVWEVQQEHELMAGGPVSARMLELCDKLLAYPLPAAPRVPDTPQG